MPMPRRRVFRRAILEVLKGAPHGVGLHGSDIEAGLARALALPLVVILEPTPSGGTKFIAGTT